MCRFPYVDDDVLFDEYGIRPYKKYEPILVRDDDDSSDLEEESYKEEEKKDFFEYKPTEEGASITVTMRREKVDYCGLSDYQTMHSIVREINPSQIICWHGPRENRDFIVKRFQEDRQYVLHTAENQQTIEVESRYNITKMRLDDELLKSLTHYTIGEYEIA